MTWHLCSNELEHLFIVVDDDNLLVAYPVTQKAQSLAPWHNKKLAPKTLWKKVATPWEQERIRLLVAAPDLLDTLEEVLGCLENWMEIADEEDQRDYDQEAVTKAHKLIKKIKEI